MTVSGVVIAEKPSSQTKHKIRRLKMMEIINHKHSHIKEDENVVYEPN